MALDKYCRTAFAEKPSAQLQDEEKGKALAGLENGSIKLEGADAQAFFHQVLTNTREGFFADPLYGGNRDMIGWKMIGFPGCPLRLPRLGLTPKRALSAASGQHRGGPVRMGAAMTATMPLRS